MSPSELTVPASSGVLAGFTDPSGLTMQALLLTGPSNGQLTLNADGSFTYIPHPGYEGTDSFTFEATDGDFVSGPETATISITTAAIPTQLFVPGAPPYSIVAGTTFGLPIDVENASNQVVTSYNGPITIQLDSIVPTDATLNGTLTVNAVDGVAQFTGLAIDKVAQDLEIAMMGNGIVGIPWGPINVTPAAATHLVITAQPPPASPPGGNSA